MGERKRELTDAEIVELVAGYGKRGGTRAEYCRWHGISESALDYYLRRGRKGKILPVEVSKTEERYAVAIRLANGRRVEIGVALEVETLARLVRVLEQK